MDVIIYHNPACGTSRNTLGLIRNAGIEPHVIEYLKTPPTRLLLRQLLQRAGLTVRDVLREKGTNRTKFLQGRVDKYTWVDLGSSYLPSELNAAFLLAQFEQHWQAHVERLDTLLATSPHEDTHANRRRSQGSPRADHEGHRPVRRAGRARLGRVR